MISVSDRITLASKESNVGIKLSGSTGGRNDDQIEKVRFKLYPNHSDDDFNVEISLTLNGLNHLIDTLVDFHRDCMKENIKVIKLAKAKREMENG